MSRGVLFGFSSNQGDGQGVGELVDVEERRADLMLRLYFSLSTWLGHTLNFTIPLKPQSNLFRSFLFDLFDKL